MKPQAPMHLCDAAVDQAWLDYNGHMNDAAYAIVFSRAVDVFMDRIAIDDTTRKSTGHTLYTLQSMIHYFMEAHLDTPLSVAARILDHDMKRLRLWLEMTAGLAGPRLAASEQLLISIDQSAGAPRVSNWLPATQEALNDLAKAHHQIPIPAQAGHGISLSRKR
jgi:acyl-CoA thioester hydrolase